MYNCKKFVYTFNPQFIMRWTTFQCRQSHPPGYIFPDEALTLTIFTHVLNSRLNTVQVDKHTFSFKYAEHKMYGEKQQCQQQGYLQLMFEMYLMYSSLCEHKWRQGLEQDNPITSPIPWSQNYAYPLNKKAIHILQREMSKAVQDTNYDDVLGQFEQFDLIFKFK